LKPEAIPFNFSDSLLPCQEIKRFSKAIQPSKISFQKEHQKLSHNRICENIILLTDNLTKITSSKD